MSHRDSSRKFAIGSAVTWQDPTTKQAYSAVVIRHGRDADHGPYTEIEPEWTGEKRVKSHRSSLGKPFRPYRKLVVSNEWKDSDGYWMLLYTGFQIDGAHAIHESSRTAASARVRDVRPCKCIDCKAKHREP